MPHWEWFGENLSGLAGRGALLDESSFAFAAGPATTAQLLEWVDKPDYECPDLARFDYQQVKTLIADCLANRETVKHLSLPPVFWRLLDENLIKAENLWGFILDGRMGWTREALAENPNQHAGVFTTATQLHILFSRWYEKHGDSLNGTGDDLWGEILAELRFSEEKFDQIRVSFEGAEQPFFLWEVDYTFPQQKFLSTITIQSPDIASWFVLFSLHKVFRLFCLLAAEVLRGPVEFDDAELSHCLFECWADIQSAMAVVQYWDDRFYSLSETLEQFNRRAQILANQFNLYEVSGDVEKPEIPYQAIGRVKLLNWFSRSNDSGMVELDVWRAHWAAMNNELPPRDHGELERYYTQWYEGAKKSAADDSELLEILERKCEEPKGDLPGIAVMRLLCNPKGARLSDESAGKLLGAAKKRYVQFEDSVKNYRKHYNSLAERQRRSKALEAAKNIAITNLKKPVSKLR
ncbi:MAG: hypothetical protein KJ798_02795 [Gammaproteobacteria bacterium]|nr:hypothetical protein [Gammaproteobacteria bacterium]MBU0849687.1 hypothetical protein [Gammaproteobacteria bacterium]MBU1266138.1 hypothetical protein [Gammaproteobacteria bacterium]MBU1529329.1 hypothetical protein [Gammaproteobacteria bacterium]MBU1779292.1 hypothetical protein [Gammaproteobacteria bacterium]